jgi:hypothetical protein
MLAMAQHRDPATRDMEQELADSIRRRQNDQGDPLEGLFTLTRRMDTEEDDQFDVDMTILDFLAFKATDLVFEWRSSSNPHQSDLPGALVTMTTGMFPLSVLKPPHESNPISRPNRADGHCSQNGERCSNTNTTDAVSMIRSLFDLAFCSLFYCSRTVSITTKHGPMNNH